MWKHQIQKNEIIHMRLYTTHTHTHSMQTLDTMKSITRTRTPIPYSLCISAVCPNTTATQIKNAFHSLGVACVSHVVLVPNYTPALSTIPGTNRAFIYIKKWETTPNANTAIRHLLSEDSNFKLMYQFPQFWRVVEKQNFKKTTTNSHNPNSNPSVRYIHRASDSIKWGRSHTLSTHSSRDRVKA